MDALLALTIALAPMPAASDDMRRGPDAADALPDDPAQRAGVLFEAGRFAEAAAAFGEAYESTGDAWFLFGRAQALRRAGNCGAAIALLHTFIDTRPPQSDADEAQRIIGACREVLGEPAQPPAQKPEPEPEPIAEDDRVESVPRHAWTRDVPGGVLLGTGAFATVAGVGFFAGSVATARDREESEAEFEERAQRVDRTAATGIALLAVGGALLVGSVIRYSIVARRGRAGAPLTWRF